MDRYDTTCDECLRWNSCTEHDGKDLCDECLRRREENE